MTEPKPDGIVARGTPKTGPGLGFFFKRHRVPYVIGRTRIVRETAQLRRELEEAVPDLTPQRKVLISQVVRCETVIMLILRHLDHAGVFRRSAWEQGVLEVQPVVEKVLTAFLNTQRLALTALGLAGKKEEPLDLGRYLEEREKEKLKREKDRAKMKKARDGWKEGPKKSRQEPLGRVGSFGPVGEGGGAGENSKNIPKIPSKFGGPSEGQGGQEAGE